MRTLSAVDFYNKLLPIEAGEAVQKEDQKTATEMKEFLMVEFGTTKVSEVGLEALKAKLDGPALIERISHRKMVAVNYKKDAIAKYQVVRRENKSASALQDHDKNATFGFSCLHYSVSEAAGALKIKILNKTKAAGVVHVRTVDGDAKAGDDYTAIDEKISFKSGQAEGEVAVLIIDDDGWEPDEDFYVELYDARTSNRLLGEDTRTRVTILDDDKPGTLVFEEKKTLRHPATERECIVVVNREQGTDGMAKVKFKTVKMGHGESEARPNIDFTPVEGELEFLH